MIYVSRSENESLNTKYTKWPCLWSLAGNAYARTFVGHDHRDNKHSRTLEYAGVGCLLLCSLRIRHDNRSDKCDMNLEMNSSSMISWIGLHHTKTNRTWECFLCKPQTPHQQCSVEDGINRETSNLYFHSPPCFRYRIYAKCEIWCTSFKGWWSKTVGCYLPQGMESSVYRISHIPTWQ